jgi:hypothetical protein
MEKLLEQLAKEWSVLSQAPFSFALLAASMFALAYLAARWKYSSVIEQVRAANETLKERLHLKTEQAEQYKDRAIKYDQKVWEVVESDTSSLSKKALSLVGQIREFIERYQRQERTIQESEFSEMSRAESEDEKRRLWDRFSAASMRTHAEQAAEYERRFKVDALILRDELRSRLSDYKPEQHADHMYEHPTNNFGYMEVASDLEKMAKLLDSANPSLKRTGTGKPAPAAELKRVCRAWHRANGVQVPVPGVRGAEG